LVGSLTRRRAFRLCVVTTDRCGTRLLHCDAEGADLPVGLLLDATVPVVSNLPAVTDSPIVMLAWSSRTRPISRTGVVSDADSASVTPWSHVTVSDGRCHGLVGFC